MTSLLIFLGLFIPHTDNVACPVAYADGDRPIDVKSPKTEGDKVEDTIRERESTIGRPRRKGKRHETL
jgi:hypothetical protein